MKDIKFAKFVLLVNALVPGAVLLWDVMHGEAGANPVNYAILTTGMLALVFLVLSLAVTPLRKMTGFNWLFHFRRTLGLYAFFYALTHFSIFFLYDRGGSVSSTISEMLKRNYLVVGSLALLSMLPLALTSFNAVIRQMGPKRWQLLHRLAYVAGILGVLHFYMQVKSDVRKPLAFAAVLTVLLMYRVGKWIEGKVGVGKDSMAGVPETGRWKGRLRVERIVQETPDVRTIRMVPVNGDQASGLPFGYQPGQYLTFMLEIEGKKVWRTYTIASSPTQRRYCEVTVKREAMGVASAHLHTALKEGDVLEVSAPAGRFTFDGKGAKRIALLAAGVGITPLMSIIRFLTDNQWDGTIYLVYCNKTESDVIFRGEIESLQQRFPNLHVTITLTRAGEGWAGRQGRIDEMLLREVIPNLTALPFYLCGPAAMLGDTRALLMKMGVAAGNVRVESFGSKKGPAATNGEVDGAMSAGFTVTFSKSNKMARIAPDRPILELAEELGVKVESECRSGICGTCKCRKLSGSVAMETEDALDEADRENGVILLCQSRALEDVIVDA